MQEAVGASGSICSLRVLPERISDILTVLSWFRFRKTAAGHNWLYLLPGPAVSDLLACVNKLQAHFTLSSSLSLFPEGLSNSPTGNYPFMSKPYTMPLWGYFNFVGPQCFLWEQSFWTALCSHPTPRQSPGGEQRCIYRTPKSLVLPSPALHCPSSSEQALSPNHTAREPLLPPQSWSHLQQHRSIPSLQWCPLPSHLPAAGKTSKSHEGRAPDAAAAISSELTVNLLWLSRLPADNLHREFVFFGFVFSTSLLFSSMNSTSPLVFYLSWQNCFSSWHIALPQGRLCKVLLLGVCTTLHLDPL